MDMDVVVIRPLEKLINALKEERESVLQRHPTWKATDARVAVFAKYANTLSSAYLGLIFQHEQLSHRQWWMSPHFTAMKPLTDEDIKNKVVEFDRFLRVGCIQMQVSAIESSFRFLRKSPEINANALNAFSISFSISQRYHPST
jgi:hypothetical protein